MTRPQKCKRGLRRYGKISCRFVHFRDDPTAEMQKGIKTSINRMRQLIGYMTRPQKCKRGLRLRKDFVITLRTFYDPTAEMQKGIKTF